MSYKDRRTILGYGAVPQPIDNEKDTEPNLFEQPSQEASTAPRCYMCGKSTWAYDDGFEAGIAFALTKVQGLLQQGRLGQGLAPDDAAVLVQWMRGAIQGKR